jgi:hypothetical protein
MWFWFPGASAQSYTRRALADLHNHGLSLGPGSSIWPVEDVEELLVRGTFSLVFLLCFNLWPTRSHFLLYFEIPCWFIYNPTQALPLLAFTLAFAWALLALRRRLPAVVSARCLIPFIFGRFIFRRILLVGR